MMHPSHGNHLFVHLLFRCRIALLRVGIASRLFSELRIHLILHIFRVHLVLLRHWNHLHGDIISSLDGKLPAVILQNQAVKAV